MALGLALLFGVMGLMNFAYGELIMAGAYTMFYTRSWGWLGMIVMTIVVVTVLSLADGAGRLPAASATPRRSRCWSPRSPSATGSRSSPGRWSGSAPFGATIGQGRRRASQPYPWLTQQFEVAAC